MCVGYVSEQHYILSGAHHLELPSPMHPWVNLCAYFCIFRKQCGVLIRANFSNSQSEQSYRCTSLAVWRASCPAHFDKNYQSNGERRWWFIHKGSEISDFDFDGLLIEWNCFLFCFAFFSWSCRLNIKKLTCAKALRKYLYLLVAEEHLYFHVSFCLRFFFFRSSVNGPD